MEDNAIKSIRWDNFTPGHDQRQYDQNSQLCENLSSNLILACSAWSSNVNGLETIPTTLIVVRSYHLILVFIRNLLCAS